MFTHPFELSLIQELHTFRSALLDSFFICCNVLDTIYFVITIIFLSWLWGQRSIAGKLAFTLLLSFLINKSLKYLFALPRPHDLDPTLGILTASTPGFPSGAAQTAILLAGVLLKEWKSQWRWIAAFSFAFILSSSRVYLGLHFPSDLLGGWVVGIFLFWLYCKLDLFIPKTRHIQKGVLLMTTAALLPLATNIEAASSPLYQLDDLEIGIPEKQLNTGSLYISSGEKTFEEWTKKDHKNTYQLIQAVGDYWKGKEKGDTFLVYGSSELNTPFNWEVVPYQDKNWFFNKYEDLKVAYNIVQGGDAPSDEMLTQQKTEYETFFSNPPKTAERIDNLVQGPSSCVFCRSDVRARQTVLEGELDQVLYDQSPVGAGEHKIHFLIIPKQHRKNFRELTRKEYVEAMQKVGFILEKLKTESGIHRIYIYHKTGRIQSVEHLHIHVVATISPEHDAAAKTNLIANMIVPFLLKLSEEEYKEKKQHYEILFKG